MINNIACSTMNFARTCKHCCWLSRYGCCRRNGRIVLPINQRRHVSAHTSVRSAMVMSHFSKKLIAQHQLLLRFSIKHLLVTCAQKRPLALQSLISSYAGHNGHQSQIPVHVRGIRRKNVIDNQPYKDDRLLLWPLRPLR